MVKSVPQALNDLGKLYEDRNKMYGDNYKNTGVVLLSMFPNGLKLETSNDFNRFSILVHLLTKISRYSEMFMRGGHDDSLDDLSVWSQMLRELDAEIRGYDIPF